LVANQGRVVTSGERLAPARRSARNGLQACSYACLCQLSSVLLFALSASSRARVRHRHSKRQVQPTDSALASYEASTVQRLSMWIGLSAVSLQRLAFRHEDAARIHWTRQGRTWVELRGSRSYVGAFRGNFSGATDRDLAESVPLPYFPGREQLWSGDGLITSFVGQESAAQDSVNTGELVNPLARGAETFYEYAIGDSVRITLPDGRAVTLRELRVTPRAPAWNLVVGSFWFDAASAQLVRAVYRLSTPTDLLIATRERGDARQIPAWLRGIVSPLRTNISLVSIEYGLVEQRYWLPRVQVLEGSAEAGPARLTMRIEHRFAYEQVNGVVADAPATVRASGSGVRAAAAARQAACDSSGNNTVAGTRFGGAITVTTVVPCSRAKLAAAAELPGSIFDADEPLSSSTRQAIAEGLGLGRQARWAPQQPTLRYGLPVTRFNRVEGLSTGIGAHQLLGAGYEAEAQLRYSLADAQVNASLAATRSNGRATLGVQAYRRLAAMNDWGDPLSLRASILALGFGRDDGAYFRAQGIEVTGTSSRFGGFSWRGFTEHQWSADLETKWSVFGAERRVLANPASRASTFHGVSLRIAPLFGRDADGLRVTTDVRVEAAVAREHYARTFVDVTAASPLFGVLDASITASAGGSLGALPPQRRFFLGGAQSLRGFRALRFSGDAFWMARTELGAGLGPVRPTVFADIGWAGERELWRTDVIPVTGSGFGVSLFDGLLRVDAARGLRPTTAWRLEAMLNARF
jgi:hypothetical protein